MTSPQSITRSLQSLDHIAAELDRLDAQSVPSATAAIHKHPNPPAWQRWAIQDLVANLELGMRYSPTWFGAATATESGRVRMLRTLSKQTKRSVPN